MGNTTEVIIGAKLMIADPQYYSEALVSVEGALLNADGSALIAKDTILFPRSADNFAPEFMKKFNASPSKATGVPQPKPEKNPGNPSDGMKKNFSRNKSKRK